MSAIVAKALNDSIGTESFKGFNTILDEQLDRLISSVDDFVENLPPRVEAAIKAASNTILTPSTDDLLYDVLLEAGGSTTSKEEGQVGRGFVFKCNGAVLIKCRVTSDKVYGGQLYYLKNDEKVVLYNRSNGIIPNNKTIIIPIVENDALSFHVERYGPGHDVQINELSLYAKVIPNASIIIS